LALSKPSRVCAQSGGTSAGPRATGSSSEKTSNTKARGLLAEQTGTVGSSTTTEADPELVALGRAERALFPHALRGVSAQFSFDAEGDWGRLYPGQAAATSLPNNNAYRGIELPEIFPNVDGRILTYLDFYRLQPEGKAILRAWAKKRGRYEGMLVSGLAKSGLPSDLVWQSLVESAHNPSIRSPAGAAGLWQFMPETARSYGLTVDRWLDERLDPERATEAAAKMMSELYRRLGNWELALAAYNMGEGGLLRTIRKYNTNDFWTLARYEAGLPWETALYVPRIIALTIAMSNPVAFGIADVVPDEPVALETVMLAPGQPLSSVAQAAAITVEQLKQLNPQLLTGRLPPSAGAAPRAVRIYVPRGKGELLRNRLARVLGPEPDLESYSVRRGDTVATIASARGVTTELVRSINQIGEGESIEAGTVLLLPRGGQGAADSTDAMADRIAVVPPDVVVGSAQRRVFYQVSSGDSLSSIADAMGVTRAELLEHNSLDPSAKLQPNMLLAVLLPKEARPNKAKYFEEDSVRVLVAGSDGFLDYHEGLRGNERIVVQAKAKDTLAKIGERHGVSVGTMERINRRSRRDTLKVGESVVVYVHRGATPERVGSTR
jgi:membrane-bound lytic murein transglycosylase D